MCKKTLWARWRCIVIILWRTSEADTFEKILSLSFSLELMPFRITLHSLVSLRNFSKWSIIPTANRDLKSESMRTCVIPVISKWKIRIKTYTILIILSSYIIKETLKVCLQAYGWQMFQKKPHNVIDALKEQSNSACNCLGFYVESN